MSVEFVIAVAVVLGLLLFFVQQVRRPARRGSPWTKRIRVALTAVILAGASIVFYAFYIEPNRLVVRQESIQIDQWPRELNDLRIGVLSDIHAGGAFIDEKKLRTIVERTNALQPEIIVILGDFISGDGRRHPLAMTPEQFAPILKEFRAPLGVYAVLGNHDWWYNGRHVREVLEQNGIKVLDDEVLKVDARGTSFWLVGLADLWTRPQRIGQTVAQLPENTTVIALTHNPDIFPNVPSRVQLLIAGHTHGAQVHVPLIGYAVEPSNRYGERYAHGHVYENGHHLFITTGIGTSIVPVRLGVPPEIVLLTVKSP
ncbi:MAG TPA: metallophosphoesterase [Pyrinomonadaceae bacterium]|nr:metallophosphoesterase [Pyrinomonadaceae bacterium]